MRKYISVCEDCNTYDAFQTLGGIINSADDIKACVNCKSKRIIAAELPADADTLSIPQMMNYAFRLRKTAQMLDAAETGFGEF